MAHYQRLPHEGVLPGLGPLAVEVQALQPRPPGLDAQALWGWRWGAGRWLGQGAVVGSASGWFGQRAGSADVRARTEVLTSPPCCCSVPSPGRH